MSYCICILKKWHVYLCTLLYANVYLLSDASPYCDVILAPRMVIVLVRCGDWHDKARGWPLNKTIIEHMCIYEGGADTLQHNNLT